MRLGIAGWLLAAVIVVTTGGSPTARAQSPGEYAFAFPEARPASEPDALKPYQMGSIFRKRGNPAKAREYYSRVRKRFPKSKEALNAHFALLDMGLEEVRRGGRYNNGLFQAIAAVPPGFASHARNKKLRRDGRAWLRSAAGRALAKPGGAPTARRYLAMAKKLGLERVYAAQLERKLTGAMSQSKDQARAEKIRAHLKAGRRDLAETLLVEWQAVSPRSPLLAQMNKEFERPRDMVTIPGGRVNGKSVAAFNIDRCEVTNRQFYGFVKARPEFRKSRISPSMNDKDYLTRWADDLKFKRELADKPVVFVSQKVAAAYCEWQERRLPSTAEWGLAAGEGVRTFPWGNEQPTGQHANFGKGPLGEPVSCKSYPDGATPQGVMNMSGNVWESTATSGSNKKVIARGGSYFDPPRLLKNDNRELAQDLPTYSSRFTGLRCAQ